MHWYNDCYLSIGGGANATGELTDGHDTFSVGDIDLTFAVGHSIIYLDHDNEVNTDISVCGVPRNRGFRSICALPLYPSEVCTSPAFICCYSHQIADLGDAVAPPEVAAVILIGLLSRFDHGLVPSRTRPRLLSWRRRPSSRFVTFPFLCRLRLQDPMLRLSIFTYRIAHEIANRFLTHTLQGVLDEGRARIAPPRYDQGQRPTV